MKARILVVVPTRTSWTGQGRGRLFRDTLRGDGHEVEMRTAKPRPSVDGFDLVIVHAFCLKTDAVRKAAERNPRCKFLAVNHSATAYMEYTNGALREMTAAIWAAKKQPNFWLGFQGQTKIGEAVGSPRIIHFPTPANLIEPREYRPPAKLARVVMAGRACPIKNHYNTLVACKLLEGEVQLILNTPPTDNLNFLTKALGMKPRINDMMPHEQWIRFLQVEPDVVLQASLTESYNYVACEAQQAGVPTVASASVAPADPEMVLRDPNDVDEMVAKIRFAIADHERLATQAIEYGRRSAEKQCSGFIEQVRMILDD